jgi:hypothetical protein
MHRLLLGLAGLTVLSSCSDPRDRRVADDGGMAPTAPSPAPILGPEAPKPDTGTWRASDSADAPGRETRPAPLPVPTPERPAAPGTTKLLALPAGTQIRAALSDSINSRHDSAGKVVTALVIGAVTSPRAGRRPGWCRGATHGHRAGAGKVQERGGRQASLPA